MKDRYTWPLLLAVLKYATAPYACSEASDNVDFMSGTILLHLRRDISPRETNVWQVLEFILPDVP